MKHWTLLQVCLAGCLCCASYAGASASPERTPAIVAGAPTPEALAHGLASAGVLFIANRGQIAHENVLFYARLFAGTVFVTDRNEVVYALPQHSRADSGSQRGAPAWAFRERFSSARALRPRGTSPSAVRVSHYKGHDPQRWMDRLPVWESLSLGEPYPGIHVTLRAAGNNVEKLFHVAPGADPSVIDMALDGVMGVSVDGRGQLVLATSLGDIVFTAPLAYQVVDGERRPVEVAYRLSEDHHYGFRLGDYDRRRELVIDPLLASTYLGGHNPAPPGNYDDDIVHGMVTAGGDVYIAGATQSPDFPTRLGYDESLDSAYPDGFITRMSPDLSTVIASTYLGTPSFDRVTDIALDDDGSIVVVGQAGYGFPLTDGAYSWSGTSPVGGGFVARLSADLSTLLASAVATPSGYPARVGLGNGGVYFGGSTNNPGFPITPDAFMDTCCPAGGFGIREYDGFAGKLSADLRSLEAMTYLGGNRVSGISVAPDGSVFITDGSDHAITGYISRMDSGLTTRSAFLTYYPGSTSGSSRTYFNAVVAGEGFVVTAGQTYMNDLPATAGAFDTDCGTDGLCDGIGALLVPRSDGFIAIYSPDLQDTRALTYLGGSDHESIRALTLGADGDVHVSGETTSIDFPTAGSGADTVCGSDGLCDPTGTYGTPAADGFVARLSADLSQLRYGSYLGGSREDRPEALALDGGEGVYVAGYTRSPDFPTTAGAFDTSYNGGTSDAFISRVATASTGGGGGGTNEPPVADAGDDQPVGPRAIVSLDASASFDPDGQVVGYHWTQVFGPAVRLYNEDTVTALFRAPNVRPGVTRVLAFDLAVTDDRGATAIDRIRIGVTRP